MHTYGWQSVSLALLALFTALSVVRDLHPCLGFPPGLSVFPVSLLGPLTLPHLRIIHGLLLLNATGLVLAILSCIWHSLPLCFYTPLLFDFKDRSCCSSWFLFGHCFGGILSPQTSLAATWPLSFAFSPSLFHPHHFSLSIDFFFPSKWCYSVWITCLTSIFPMAPLLTWAHQTHEQNNSVFHENPFSLHSKFYSLA